MRTLLVPAGQDPPADARNRMTNRAGSVFFLLRTFLSIQPFLVVVMIHRLIIIYQKHYYLYCVYRLKQGSPVMG
jgi:hypothetical protein